MMGKENLDPNGQKQGDPKEALNIANLNFETGKSLNIIPDWISENQERDELISNTILRLYRLSIKILRMLARALEIEDDETHRIKVKIGLLQNMPVILNLDLHLDFFIIHVKIIESRKCDKSRCPY